MTKSNQMFARSTVDTKNDRQGPGSDAREAGIHFCPTDNYRSQHHVRVDAAVTDGSSWKGRCSTHIYCTLFMMLPFPLYCRNIPCRYRFKRCVSMGCFCEYFSHGTASSGQAHPSDEHGAKLRVLSTLLLSSAHLCLRAAKNTSAAPPSSTAVGFI